MTSSVSGLPVVIVLAAGRGERFAASGGKVHKLHALLAGKRVLDHVLDAVRASGLPYYVVQPDALRLAACQTLVVESENWPQRGQFLPDLHDFLGSEPKFSQPKADPSGATHGVAEKLVSDPNKSKDGEKWTAAVNLQPTIPKSDRLLGMGDSIAAGIKATPDAPGWLILPADLPLIRSETLLAIALAPASAVTVPRYQGQRGHPVRFAAACGPELLNLQGNQGAAQIVRAQEAINSVAFIDTDDAGTVTDIDTLDDLRRAEALLVQR